MNEIKNEEQKPIENNGVKSIVSGSLPTYEDYKTEYQRRSECEFPHPTMKPHEAYMIGFNQCYNWIKREMLKGNDR